MNVFFPKESKVHKSAAPNLMMTSDSNNKDKTKNERLLTQSNLFLFSFITTSLTPQTSNKVHHIESSWGWSRLSILV